MTVGELIALLRTFPSDLPVLIPSYEDGYEVPSNVSVGPVVSMFIDQYCGTHDRGPDDAPERAVFFERTTD